MSLPKSIKIGYAVFFDHIHTPELLRARSAQLFDWIAEGKLKVRIGGEYRLADAAKAHADMESRRTTGKLLLVVFGCLRCFPDGLAFHHGVSDSPLRQSASIPM